ncbi:cyclin-dependent kinase 1-like [Adelges cooleyi]|uniref:cyclin-dependent kinase 1-like n=1 Tax=Adelges cooleyi TaxID=133065 RepID=UPI0021806E14|nr:cyclin-dependent kinase 1-like [Adelges cooleyi]
MDSIVVNRKFVLHKKNNDLEIRRYVPMEMIGRGSYGIVMKCKDKRTNEVVAIKKITSSYFSMPEALREITILKKLSNHTHLISFLNVFRVKQILYIVFPYMDYNMYEYINKHYSNGLGYDLTKEYMIQVIRGIDYMHEHHVIHRDIKPDNILLTRNGVIKLCDLGISKLICPTSFGAELLMTPGMGTLWYQAPEMLLGIKKYGTEVDIWSIGIVFTEFMSGQPVITGKTSINQYRSIIRNFGIAIEDQKYFNEIMKNTHYSIVSMNYTNSYKYENVGKALKNYYPLWPNELVEIVSKCLQFKPTRRKSAKYLLNEPYFRNGDFLEKFAHTLNDKIRNNTGFQVLKVHK